MFRVLPLDYEAEHKGWCDTELSTNEQTRKEKTEAAESLHAEIDELEAEVGPGHKGRPPWRIAGPYESAWALMFANLVRMPRVKVEPERSR